MKNKYLLLLVSILCLLSFNSIGQNFWEVVPTPDSANLVSIAIHNNGDTFLGSNGVYLSQDNGESWEFKGLFGKTVFSIATDSIGNIYTGTLTELYRSKDYGDTWEMVHYIHAKIHSICTGSNGLVYAGCSDNEGVLRSFDYGDTWDTCLYPTGLAEVIMDLAISNDGVVYAAANFHAGWGGGIYKSANDGDDWEHIGLSDHYVFAVAVDGYDNVYAGTKGQHYTGQYGFYKLNNISGEWIHMKNDVTINDIVLAPNNDIYIGCTVEAGGHPYGVFRSLDGGETWGNINPGLVGGQVTKMSIDPNHFLYAIASSPSTLSRSIDPIVVSIKDFTNETAEIETYPNPCSEYLNIHLKNIKSYSQIRVRIFDSSGNLVYDGIFHRTKDNALFLNLNEIIIPKGIFYLQVIQRDNLYTRKILKF